ncbi:glycine--tRNA ligase subunit beta [Aeribacillus pallidus]|uniref:glycine--tRNA ligase subunit beta n=1 Tax=Aeribacillus TaxID=1055323 RepID=UPI0007B497AC|nr:MULTISPECIES: glycine--tRNA ligase subunit beta [Aeribacillus]KZM56759.1 glycine--tRNA ligase subunit beta [Aeribacillus pallidus]MED0649718.1 glycine--tRNA ligase subunit beta [Aeribacillus composti]MED4485806.1 glycine--tRNA ligase subunit beta [Aeribacillus pallidus]BBU40240.1 glycine--tRNA ligase beta subunit [Aeribacillus pallidus]
MNKRDLLIEIGLEEMPAGVILSSIDQLADKVGAWLDEHRISYAKIKKYSTPRRLAVLVEDVNEKQEDLLGEAKGPAKKIAVDENGNWTKAALGFARSQGASTNDISFKEVNGVEYAFVQTFQKGKETKELLPGLEEIIQTIHFPKNMRWGNWNLRYIRPIQWLVVLFGQDIIPFSITDVPTGNVTYGHRFLGTKAEISTPRDYENTLLNQFVVADYEKRKQMIIQQLEELERKENWIIPVDEDLLEEVTNLVEYPTALYGSFEDQFLTLPEEVLVTTMKEHQRYFPVKNKDGKLLPFFVTVKNGNDQNIETIAKGNEKVLRARLSDANFFYEEDKKLAIDTALEKLEKIVFHEELGSIGDKVRRIVKLSEKLSEKLECSNEEKAYIKRTASICKFDIVTQMVYEFPELQGIMGEKYALLKGEHEEVAKGINEHYMPRHASDKTPETLSGAIVGLADKLDTIAGFFSIGLIPTGSQDPYALRRQASGIVQILRAKQWRLELEELFDLAINVYGLENKDNLRKELLSFFQMRVKFALHEENVRHDIIESVLQSNYHEVNAYFERAAVLSEESQKGDFKEVIESLSRVVNISSKGQEGNIKEELFEKEEEKTLYQAYLRLEENFVKLQKEGNFKEAFLEMKALKPVIDRYFDNIMVMAEDESVKQNRLSQMVQLTKIITSFAKVNEIIVK